MKAIIISIALACALAGCATQNVAGTASYQLVPQDRVIGTIAQPSENEPFGTVVVKRDPGLFGAALSSVLLLDGKPAARIKPGEFIEFRSQPGEHILGVSWSDNLGAAATSSTRELAVEIRPGQTYYFRVFPQAGSGVVIERASQ